MKTDLATSIFAAVVGVVVAFIVCNLFLPELEPVSFSSLVSGGSTDYSSLVEPSDEVFNFRALNPTVEVYVGQCTEYDENGRCKDDVATIENTEEEVPEENVEGEDNANEENGAE